MSRWRLLAVPLLFLASSPLGAQPPSIQPLGVLDPGDPSSQANGVSANGATVVGESNVAGNRHAFRWRAGTGMVDLGTLGGSTSSAEDVSDNGSVVVGAASNGAVERAFRWTQGGGMVDLGTVDGAVASSSARAVSANGAVVVGNSGNASEGTTTFRWTNGTGMVDLGSFAGPFGFATAEGVSDNGAVVVGFSEAPANASRRVAFRWKGGVMEDLSLAGHPISAITCVGGDGKFMAGVNSKTLTVAGFRTSLWKPNGAVQKFSSLGYSVPFDISLDGLVIVGANVIETDGSPINEATVWIDGKEQALAQVLASAGADLSEWSALNIATAISQNGRVVVGVGTVHPDDDKMAFRAVLPNRGPTVLTPKVTNVVPKATTTRVTLSAKVLDPDSASLTARWRVDGVLRKTQTRDPGQSTTFVFDYPSGDTPVSLTVSDGDKSAKVEGVVRVTANNAKFVKDAAASSEAAPVESSFAVANGSSLDAYRLSTLGLAGSASDASLSGYRYGEAAILAESYADESAGASASDAEFAHRQLRYAQAVYSQAAASEHVRAFAETGDEAQLSAASRWGTAALEALDELAE